jgi:hypothetical protein
MHFAHSGTLLHKIMISLAVKDIDDLAFNRCSRLNGCRHYRPTKTQHTTSILASVYCIYIIIYIFALILGQERDPLLSSPKQRAL